MSAEAAATGPKYDIWIEDTIHSWDKDTISVPEIRKLGGWPAGCPISAVDLVASRRFRCQRMRCTMCRRARRAGRS